MMPVVSPVKQAMTPAIPLKLGDQFYSMAGALCPVPCQIHGQNLFLVHSKFHRKPVLPGYCRLLFAAEAFARSVTGGVSRKDTDVSGSTKGVPYPLAQFLLDG